jgi:hypothetical protein
MVGLRGYYATHVKDWVGDVGMTRSASLRLAAGEDEGTAPRQGEYRVLLLATVITTTRELAVKLRSLSPTGAIIEGFNLPSQGTDVILKRGLLEAFATVTWAEGRRCSIEFETPLSDEDVLAQIRQPRTGAAPLDPIDQRRPGFHVVNVTEEDRRTAAEWARPTGRLAYRD